MENLIIDVNKTEGFQNTPVRQSGIEGNYTVKLPKSRL